MDAPNNGNESWLSPGNIGAGLATLFIALTTWLRRRKKVDGSVHLPESIWEKLYREEKARADKLEQRAEQAEAEVVELRNRVDARDTLSRRKELDYVRKIAALEERVDNLEAKIKELEGRTK